VAVVKKKVVKKKVAGKSTPVVSLKANFAGRLSLSLPTKKTEPIMDMSAYTWLLYGERHIGKTTLASNFNDPFFLFFEPGGKAKRLRAEFIPTWEHFLGYVELLEQNPGYCQTVVIDPGGQCYELCMDYTCRRLGITHPQDEPKGGKGWKAVEKEFVQTHNRIFAAGYGMIALAHSVIREVKRRDGSTYNKLTVELGAQAFRYYCGTFDTTGYYTYDTDGSRILTIRGSAGVEAGTRCDEMFHLPDGSGRVGEISMGTDPKGKEGYLNLESAFKNSYYKGIRKEVSVQSRKVAKKKKK